MRTVNGQTSVNAEDNVRGSAVSLFQIHVYFHSGELIKLLHKNPFSRLSNMLLYNFTRDNI